MQRGDDYLLFHLFFSSLPDTVRGSAYGEEQGVAGFIRHTQNTLCQKACVHGGVVLGNVSCDVKESPFLIWHWRVRSDQIGTEKTKMLVAAFLFELQICYMTAVNWLYRGFVKLVCDKNSSNLHAQITLLPNPLSPKQTSTATREENNPAMKRGLFQHWRQQVQWLFRSDNF